MVTISNYFVRQSEGGKTFISLELQGDVEMIQSSQTGRFYATARRCTISSTFTEEIAKTLVGKAIKGRIDRIQCPEYTYVIKETGEEIMLSHCYVYNPEDAPDMKLYHLENELVRA